ncbi:MAG: hypothetical protein ACLR4Z_02420 [Butyricicoccaceae bacterium]
MWTKREYLIVRGTVQQIVYYNDENGYAVLRLAVGKRSRRSRRPARFPTLDWVRSCIHDRLLGDASDLRRAVCDRARLNAGCRPRCAASRIISASGLIRGIGPRLAARIAEKFGEDTFDILMHEPERLSELRGITDRKREGDRPSVHRTERNAPADGLS